MTTLTADQILPEHAVAAVNFALESTNKIHSDEVAAEYGFHGGLVPGLGTYAYMTVPIVRALGRSWLERGRMTAKFIKPIYDGETVRVHTKVASAKPLKIVITVLNERDTLCAVGEAFMPEGHPEVELSKHPIKPVPHPDNRLPATLDVVKLGVEFGSLCFRLELDNLKGEAGAFLDDMRDPLELYRGAEAVCHPAMVVAKANEILKDNVALGPWIHTASDVLHYALPRDGETLCLRGRVAHSYAKRGHEITVLDLALTGEKERIISHLTHTAIIKPATVNQEKN